jgi:steroid 5-alpha reductase family enzyme
MTGKKANLISALTCLGLAGLSLIPSAESGVVLGGLPALVGVMALIVGIQWVAFVPAWINRTEKFFDLVGTQTFVVVALLGLAYAHHSGTASPHHYALAAAVAVWGLRLGPFLVRRIHKAGKDGRFDEIKLSFPRFFMAWTVQAVWVFATAYPVWIILTSKRTSALDLWVGIGLVMWLVGFAIEVTADRQKSAFRARHPEGEVWIDEGLWALAQHPNYCGEILLWTGLFVSGLGFYQGLEWVAVVSPLFVFGLLTRGSGVPLIQERNQERWGDNPDFQRYLQETNLLVPIPGRRPRRPKVR